MKLMSNYQAQEGSSDQLEVPNPFSSLKHATPRPSVTGTHHSQQPTLSSTPVHSTTLSLPPNSKGRLASASPEVQPMEGFKRLFAGPRAIRRAASEEVGNDYAASPVPFRSILDDDKASVADLTTDLMDPEIALYTTDDEVDTPHHEGWMFNLTSNYEGPDMAPDYFNVCSNPSTMNDEASDSMGKMSRLKIHRTMKNEELRQQFTRDKMKRRSLSLSHARSTKFSSRPVTRQISRVSLTGSESILENGSEHGSLSSTTVSQRSYRGGSMPLTVELNPASLQHMRRLLRQVLYESDLSPVREWEEVIMNLMLKVCDNVQPDVRAGDDIDIRHYVKIKKIPGGTPRDSEYVHGVACSKNVAHKRMVRAIQNPRILLLTFALEYERVENQFLSLEPVLSQEREHLKNLVARVVALKPDVVLVEKTVARLALEFLLEANVAVAYNVKPSVIEALARCTRADVISSIDKLALEPRLGSCEQFQVKTFMHSDIPGYRKSFLYFEGCPRQLGCTLMLRGANMETLAKLKQIADLMAFVVYNLKLETNLFRNQYTAFHNSSPSAPDCSTLDLYCDILTGPEADSIRDPNVDRVTHAIRLYQQTILSVSPHVRFPPPYLLMRMKEQEHQMAAAHRKQQGDKTKGELVKMGDYRAVAEGADMTDPESIMFAMFETNGLPDNLLASLETRAGITHLLESAESLSPFGHQSITVLYSNSCAATTIPCQAPEQHLIEYYRATDMTLGQYLEELYFNSDFICASKLCDRKMLVHLRCYAHWQGRVNVVIEEFPCPVPGMESTILMWSKCKVCGQTTPHVPMSEDTWKYSFGKYLELWYYCARSDCKGSLCPHGLHQAYARYFGLKNLAVRFEYDPIDLLEVSVPPMKLRIKPEQSTKLRGTDADALRDMITRYFDSISERIKNFTYDIVPKEKVQACTEAMTELGRRAGLEKKYMLQLLQQTMISSAMSDTIALNAVFRALHEKVTTWDIEFANFVRTYLQSDSKEIRRLTAAQIRRMFADRDVGDRASSINTVVQESPVLDFEMTANPTMFDASLPLLGSSPSANRNQLWFRSLSRPGERDRDMSLPGTYTQRRLSLEMMRNGSEKKGPGVGVELPVVGSRRPFRDNFTEFHGRQPHSPSRQSNGRSTPVAGSPRMGLFPRPSIDDITLYRSRLYRPSIEWLLKEDENAKPFEIEDDPWSPPGAHPAENLLGEDSESIREGGDQQDDPFWYGKADMGDDEDFPMEWNTISGVSVEALEGDKSAFPPGLLLMGGERTSIMKTITNLWTGNAANFLPLTYPISATEHVFPDSLVVVREDEPSSIIAFTLNSRHYKEKLLSMQQGGGDGLLMPPAPDDTQSRYSIELDDQYGDIEETLLRGTGTHIRYHDRYVVKQLSRLEMDSLYKFAPAYFEYMSQAFFHELPTVLAKIFGIYRISFKNPSTGRSMRMDLFVMENLFYERKISRIFDLKGSMRNRHVQSTGRQNEVLLDENLVEFIYESPLFIREHSKKLLRASVWNDTLFLSKLNVMDYSLLVGIDDERNELVVGIVDYIRTFTWDKKLESWVKETAFLGGGGKEPTIVSPRQYKNRFREAMERYFLMVPDKFTSPKSFIPPGQPM
ncbi:1-phosphatidylinositol-3-phosphate 5-kinase [Rhizophlyctis rosea]|uniref:1-phosphatidylinositol-3-phosphate 5-kinase n=1 Tax=Rhizophlyctis rosea TaxID=64517 RepID=A0AAD5S7L3_9FUNG|nr:1-phosphatidylinositol-3-phosphate 5-kinase [Rhizophlyctis rosea]